MCINSGNSWSGLSLLLKANCLALLLLLAGCGSLRSLADYSDSCKTEPVIENATNISVFLNIVRHDSFPTLKVKINYIEFLIDDTWVPMSLGFADVNSVNAISVQKFLGRQWLRGRIFRGVRVNVASASADGRALPLLNADSEIMLENPVELEPGSRKVLLLQWDPARSFSAGGFMGMALTADVGGTASITANLAFVACPDIDTIYVVRTDNYQVIDAFAVNGKPSYLVADSGNKKVYVLSSSLNRIFPYDVTTNLPGSEITIPLASSLIFMAINIRTQTAYVLDGQGVLTSIDLVSGNMLTRNRVGNRPNYLYFIDGVEKLAVCSSFDQSVYLVNPDTLAIEDHISLGSAPHGLVSWGNYLYIAEGVANTVSVYDLSTRMMLKSVHVGFSPNRFVTSNSSVYVTSLLDGTLAIMQGGQYSVGKEITVGKSAREMIVAEKQRLLFVGEGDCDGSLAVIDTTGNQLIGRIELGAKPLGIAVIE